MSKLEHVTSVIADNPLFSAFVGLMEKGEDHGSIVLRVLTYHRIDVNKDEDRLDPRLISASPDTFARQMGYLTTQYKVVSMTQVLDAYEAKRPLPPRAVLITFDDAYRDFAKNAWPVLKSFGLAATLFVPTAFPGDPARSFWWDQLWRAVMFTARRDKLDTPIARFSLETPLNRKQAFFRLRRYVKTLPYADALVYVAQIRGELGVSVRVPSVLDWDELRRLKREGLTLGSHTRTHPRLDELGTEQISSEIDGSFHDLLSELGSVLPVFAYPGGSFDDRVAQALEKSGVAMAFTTVRGVNNLQKADRLRLRRINIGRHTTATLLRAKLLPRLSSLKVFR